MYKKPNASIKISGTYLFKTKEKDFLIQSFNFERHNDTEDALEIQDELRNELGSIIVKNSALTNLSKGKSVKASSFKNELTGTIIRLGDTSEFDKHQKNYDNKDKYVDGGEISKENQEAIGKLQKLIDSDNPMITDSIKEKAMLKIKELEKIKTEKKDIIKKKEIDNSKKSTIKVKEKIKVQTGKSEQECEEILAKYKELADKNKKRINQLDKADELISGTTEINAGKVIDNATDKIADKIVKEVEQAEKEAERQAKKEVSTKGKTEKEIKDAIDKKVVQKIEKQVSDIAKEMFSKTKKFIVDIQGALGSENKEDSKQYLINLRNEIDKMLSKYEDGGMVQDYTIEQLVHPFSSGGLVGSNIIFSNYGEQRNGVITDELENNKFQVSTSRGNVLVEKDEVISISSPIEKRKRFGLFEEGGSINE